MSTSFKKFLIGLVSFALGMVTLWIIVTRDTASFGGIIGFPQYLVAFASMFLYYFLLKKLFRIQ